MVIVVSGRCPKKARLCASIFLLSPKARQKAFSLRSLTHDSPRNESVLHRIRHKKHWTIRHFDCERDRVEILFALSSHDSPCNKSVLHGTRHKKHWEIPPSDCVRVRVEILFALSSWAKSKEGQKDWNGWSDPKGHAKKKIDRYG